MRRINIILFFLFCSLECLYAQYEITGTVFDEEHYGITGANVKLKSSPQGTITDSQGYFKLEVPSANPVTVVISFIGFHSQEVTLTPGKSKNIELKPDVVALDEFVVVGYNKVKKSHLTGAVASIKGDDVLRSTTTDAAAALQGKIAGVVVERNSGTPGAGVSIKVRGIGTLGSTEPLYIVDGIYSSSLMVSSEEIESIEVLKDASAAAIYGSRAANGVVIVTTKKGVKGMPKVEYSGSYGTQWAEGLPEMANGFEFCDYWYRVHAIEDKLKDYPQQYLPENAVAGTDWYDEMYRTAPFQRHNIRISGGGENLSSSLSIDHSNQEGTYINTGYKDYGVLLNANYDRKRWHFGTTMKLGQSERKGIYDAGQLSTLIYSPLALRANADGTFDDGVYDYQRGFDPVFYANNFYKNWESQNFTGLVFASIDIIKGLSARININYNYGISKYYEHNPSLQIPGRVDPSLSSRIETHSKSNSLRSEGMLNFNRDFRKHRIDAVVGLTKGTSNWENLYIRADNLVNDKLPVVSGDIQVQPSLSKGGDLGYFAQANYAYDNRYLFGASVRRDGSSKFHKNYRYGTFPSFSVGWNIHKESFFKVPFINELKLRASWGQLGNSAIGEYMYEASVDVINQQLNYIIGSKSDLWNGGAQMSYASPGVRWETSTTWNVGVDVTLLNNHLDATLEVFNRETTDALIAIPLPLYTGSFNDPAQNIGKLRNSGVEFSASWKDYNHPFKYSISGNISFLKDKVVSLGEGNERPIYGGYVGNLDNGVNITTVGRSIAEFYLIKTDGLFRTQEDLNNHVWTDPVTGATKPIQPKAQLGDVKYIDYNNDGMITDADKQFCGKSAPDFYYSLSLRAEYKGFDLELFFNGEQGKKIFNYAQREALAPQSVFQNIERNLANNSWTPEHINAKYPRMGVTDPNGNGDIFTDRWLENGSFLRLQNVQLGYTLPKNLLSKIKISNLRVYLNTTNLFTITSYSLGNPEIGKEVYVNEAYSVLRRGVNSWQYPMFRTLSGGIQLSF